VPTEGGEAADVILIEVNAHEISANALILDDGTIPNTIDLAVAAGEPAHLQWNGSRVRHLDGQSHLVCGYPIDLRWPVFQATRATHFSNIRSDCPAEGTLFGDIRPGFSGGPVLSANDPGGLRLVGITCRCGPISTSLVGGTPLQTYGGNFVRLDAILDAINHMSP
jgi:hypothetical protein